MNTEPSLTRDADADANAGTETTAALSPQGMHAARPSPGLANGVPRPDDATCVALGLWSAARLQQAGVSAPAAMVNHLGQIIDGAVSDFVREVHVGGALRLLRGLPPHPEVAELTESLQRLMPTAGSAVGIHRKEDPVARSARAAPRKAPTTQGCPVRSVRLDSIVVDPVVQPREKLNHDAIADYAEAMEGDTVFPAVALFEEPAGGKLILADGFHRVLAATRIGRTEIPAEVRVGTIRDAMWYALGANRANGLRPTSADRASAIVKALREFPEKSQTQIADHVGYAQSYVNKVKQGTRDDLSGSVPQAITSDNLPEPARVTGKDGKSYPATRRGKIHKGEGEVPAPQAAGIPVQDGTPPADSTLGIPPALTTGLALAPATVPTTAPSPLQRWVDQLWQVAFAKPREDWPVIAEAMRVVIRRLEDAERAA